MERPTLLGVVEVLGREFARRGMRNHVRVLRLYYLALRAGLDRGGKVEVSWSEEMVLDWMGFLQLEPCRERFAVRDASYRCACDAKGPAKLDGGHARTRTVWPGGAQFLCSACGAAWIVLDRGRGAVTGGR